MLGKLALCLVLIVTLSVPVIADESTDIPSRYLSAEAQREIRNSFDEVSTDLKNYQDENFRLLDNEMRNVVRTAVQRMVIGVIGAIMIGGGLMALLIYRITKRYSLKDYEDRIRQLEESQQSVQQDTWVMPQEQTFSGQYGQSTASNASVFNNWQAQPPYQGGWEWQGGKNG